MLERDSIGRTPFDIACHLGFKNIVLYLVTKQGSPGDYLVQEFNVDNLGRNCFHGICYRGNFEVATTLLNIERAYLKKILLEQLLKEKNKYRLKNMDIKHGQLSTQIYHDSDIIKRHEEFNIRVYNLLEKYSKDILDRFR